MAKCKSMKRCEACDSFEVQWNLADSYDKKVVYRVCTNCLDDLVNLSLSKKQFFNLLDNGHDPCEHLLHSDFYDDNGNALQYHK